MNKEGFIKDISQKLFLGCQLKPSEIDMIIRALRESNNYLQKPYYEVIYHDECDNTETRIMNPVHSTTVRYPSGELIQEDRFDLEFRRIIKGNEDAFEQTLGG